MKQKSKEQYIGAAIDQMKSKVTQPITFCLVVVISFFPLDKIKAQPLLTLEDAVAIALENNYDIRLAKSDSALLALDYSYRNAVFFPQLNANVGTTWTDNNQRQEFTDGTSREGDVSTNNLNGSVALNWVLFDGMRMFALRDKAEAYASLGGLNMRNQIVNTVSEVINAYYLIVRQKQMLKAIEEQMSLSQVRVDLSQRKLEIGLGTKQEYLQSQIDLNAQKSAKLQQETYIRELKVILNQRINPGPDGTSNLLSTDYEVTDSIPIDFVMELEDIRSQLELTNPLLQISRKNLDIANINLQEARSGRWPTVQFNSAYNFSRTNNNLALNPFLPIFNQNKGFNYGFSASIPILNYRNTDRLVEQSKLNIQYQSLQYASERSRLTLNVINAYNLFQLQKDILELEESNILLARENVSITQETYRLGTTTFIQLREAEKSLEDAYDRLIAARYNAKVAETELMRLRGEIVK
jgi:outer membrane protein TolC